jgi:rod shape-determining protein MreD
MNFGSTFRTAVAFTILVLLHYTLRPMLGWRAPIDFLVIAALLVAVRVRPGMAALVGFVMGLAADSLTPDSFGAGALALTAVSFGASWLKPVFFADNLFLNGFFFFLGKWTFDIVRLLAEHRLGGVELVMEALVWSPLAAALTALAGVVLLILLRPLLRTSTA